MAIRGAGFAQGLQLGRGIFNDAENSRRQDAIEARAQAEENRRQAEFARRQSIEGDYDNLAAGALPVANTLPPVSYGAAPDVSAAGVSPYAGGLALGDPTTSPSAPVAGPIAPASTGLRLPSYAAEAAAPATAPAMSDEQMTRAAGSLALRQGNTTGYFASQDRAKAQKKEAAYDAFGKKLLTMTDDQFNEYINNNITKDPNLPARIEYDPKTHLYTVNHDGGPPQQMNRAQAMTHLLSAFQIGNGDVQQGVATQLALYQQQHEQARQGTMDSNTVTEAVGKQGLAADAARRQDALAMAKIKLEEAQGNRMAAIASRQAAAMNKPVPIQGMVDKVTGEPVLGFITPDGKITKIDAPAGTRFLKDPASGPPTRKELLEYGTKLIESGFKMPTGKAPSLAEATQLVQEALNPAAAGPGIDVSAVAAALKAGKGSPAAKPAGTPLGLSIGSPPAPAVPPQQQAAEIRARLAADDQIRNGGNDPNALGFFGRAMQQGQWPLGMAERQDLEDRLRRLQGQ